MSTSEDEFEHGGDDVMDIEKGSNDHTDSEFGEDLQNGKFGDHNSKQKSNGKRKLARPASGQKYYTEEEGDKQINEDHFQEGHEEKIFEQLRAERISDVEFFGSLAEFGGVSGRQSKGKKAMVDEMEARIHYLAPKKIKELEKLTDPQKVELIKKESPELLSVLMDFKKSLKEVKNKFLPLLSYLRNKKFKISEGISYLDVKFELLLSYCMNLAFYILIKLQGKPIKDHPVLRRLVYIKSLLSKLKPLDKKLEYQINKLLRMANQQNLIGENYNRANEMQLDPLSHAPRPGKIMTEITTETRDQRKDPSKPGIYVPPKLAATVQEEDKKKAKKERIEAAKSRKLYQHEFVRELEQEVNEEPDENFIGDPMKEMEDDYDREKNRFEEDNFTRIPDTRFDRKRLHEKRKKLASRADDLGDFERISQIVRDNFAQEEERKERGKQKLQDSINDYIDKKSLKNMRHKGEEEAHNIDGNQFRSIKKVKKSKSPGRDFSSKGKGDLTHKSKKPKSILKK